MIDVLVLIGVAASVGLLMWPKLARAVLWRATVTPLASIIGSGFLVLGPILAISYGAFAPLVMLGLCGAAYLFGASLRYNIAQIDTRKQPSTINRRLESLSAVVLAFAYVISVAYYLNLFGAFSVSLTPFDSTHYARLVTTGVFLVILAVGWFRGFSALERMEQISVGLKLAIIVGLLVGLVVYFAKVAQADALMISPSQTSGWQALILAAGLIVTVQGFETSRYLGATYSAQIRIRSMRLAQALSTGIYMVYVVLLTYAFDTSALPVSETAIIDLMGRVTPILPLLLVAAALSAQFSAAVADTSGSGGLMVEITRGLITNRQAYVLLVGLGLFLTWSANVFEIISYASRAFAAYYTLQALIAAEFAFAKGKRAKSAAFVAIAAIGAFATVFGVPVE